MECLQLGNMEDWMNQTPRRQVQLVCSSTNLLQDMVGTKVLESELGKGTIDHGILNIRLEFEQNLITNLKLLISSCEICMALHLLLCSGQPFFQ